MTGPGGTRRGLQGGGAGIKGPLPEADIKLAAMLLQDPAYRWIHLGTVGAL
jgi:hypothetical protein